MKQRSSLPAGPAAQGVIATSAELIALGRGPLAGARPARSRVATQVAGQHSSRFRGLGMEFSELRAYQPGDDVRAIDWRVTARMGRPYSKCFEAERERPVWLLVDLGASMRFGTRGAFKSVAAARAAALYAWAAYRAGERIGGIIFGGASTVELPPGRTRRHLLQLLEALADTSAGLAVAQRDSLAQQLRWLAPRLRSGSRTVIVSDFYELDAATSQALQGLTRHCDVTLVHVYDVLECSAPPPGRYRISDGRRVRSVRSGPRGAWQRRVARAFEARRAALCELAAGRRMELVPLRTDQSLSDIHLAVASRDVRRRVV